MSGNVCSISPLKPAILIERFQSGESGAFDEIADRYRDRVYRLAYHFTHNREDAYDISQEVFIKVFKHLSSLDDKNKFNTWLRRLIVNTCIDHLRRQKKKEITNDLSFLEYIADTSAEPPNRSVESREMQRVISRAVAQLPKRQKSVFVLRHYEDLSLKEVAEVLRCPLGTVKANLFHANRRLRELLLPYVSQT